MELDFGKLGFGFLRLPQTDDRVDLEATKEMVDLFLQRGFRYFDTAYTYLNGQSESTLRQALVERYPREAYMISTKLPVRALRRGSAGEHAGVGTSAGVAKNSAYAAFSGASSSCALTSTPFSTMPNRPSMA